MTKIDALLDSNVLIAMLVGDHEHHIPSLSLLSGDERPRFAVAAHSYAETYNILTRKGLRTPFQFTPAEGWAAIESVRAMTELVGLTPQQILEAIRIYAGDGGIGARLYDRLIGEVAVAHGLPAIVTWNTTHIQGLFPNLHVATPREFMSQQT